jgi:hypothetical protein
MTTFIKEYSSKSSAVRRAKTLGIKEPIFQVKADGRVALFKQETIVKSGPVQTFRQIFNDNFGSKSWSEIIALAVEAGVKENTAKTYYYKLKAAQ